MALEQRTGQGESGGSPRNFDYDHLPQLFDAVRPLPREQRDTLYDQTAPWAPFFQTQTGNQLNTVLDILTGELRVDGSCLIEPLQNHLEHLSTTRRAPNLDHRILDLVDMEIAHAPWLAAHNHRVSVRAQRHMAIASVRDIIRFTQSDFPDEDQIEDNMKTYIRPKLLATGYGGLIHDVGKIGTASSKPFTGDAGELAGTQRIDLLWNFPGKNLDNVQKNLIRLHPWIGIIYAALAGINDPKNKMHRRIITFIANHHESIDGTGYPRGLRGVKTTPIGIIGRLSDIGDVIAHLSDRPYNDASELPPRVQYETIMRECRLLPYFWEEVASAAENMSHVSQSASLSESPLLPGTMQRFDLPLSIDMVRMVHYNTNRLSRRAGSPYALMGADFRDDPEWTKTERLFADEAGI